MFVVDAGLTGPLPTPFRRLGRRAVTADRWPSGSVGLGSIGRRHARLLAERERRRRPRVRRRPRGGRRPPGVTSSANVERAARHVRRRGDRHSRRAPRARSRSRPAGPGSPVLVEKPVERHASTGRTTMAGRRERLGVPVLVGHVLRHLPVLQRASELLADGAIGTPCRSTPPLGAYETLEVARYALRRRPPATGCRSTTCHEWHYLQWLLGPIARACAAIGHTGGDLPLRQDPNVVDVLLELAIGRHRQRAPRLRRARRRAGRSASSATEACSTIDVARRRRSRCTRPAMARRSARSTASERDEAFRRQLDHFVDDRPRGAAPLGADRRGDPCPRRRRSGRGVVRGRARGRTSRRDRGSSGAQIAVQPPSTGRFTPVTYCDGVGRQERHRRP